MAASVVALLLAAACDDPAGPAAGATPAFAAVAAGDEHTCALDLGGRAYCWGSNAFGQLGAEGIARTAWPQPVAIDSAFATLSGGFAHTCGVTAGGAGYCWGRGAAGQLGTGSRDDESRPTAVATDTRLQAISAGHAHTCAVTVDGRALCWGDNAYGQLGTGTARSSAVPAEVDAAGVRFVAIAAGHTHTCATASSGQAYCWGDNASAQLGTASFEPSRVPVSVRSDQSFAVIGAGFETTCGLTAAGGAYCWGSNESGRLGSGGGETEKGNPFPVSYERAIAALAAGSGGHACALSGTGAAFCWGAGAAGQLGDGETASSALPSAVVGNATFLDLAAGLRHTCGVTLDGGILCWGAGGAGQLGSGAFEDATVPVPVGG